MVRRSPLVLPLILLAAATCARVPPPDTPSPEPPAATPAPALRFPALRDALLDQWLADQPAWGRRLGLHAWDGKVADHARPALEARIARLERAVEELAAVPESALSADDALDLRLLRGHAEQMLFELSDLRVHERRPLFYDELFAVNVYLDRDYAPLEARVRKLVEHEEAALAEVEHVRKNLVSPLSRPIVETAIKVLAGYAAYLRGDVVRVAQGVGDAALQARFLRANGALADAADRLAADLKERELPRADSSHILGAERFRKLLRVQEGLDLPLADFKRMGEENLRVNKAVYEVLRERVQPRRPAARELLRVATELMEGSRRFLEEKRLVSLPGDDGAVLKETPPYMRWNQAFLDASGPFEEVKRAFYYITLPDPAWPAREQAEYIPTRGVLLATTVHEVFPGHFLQGKFLDRAPTRAQKMITSYSFVEGWAHYAEQLMIEEGFGSDDPESRLGQLSDALLRNCRFVVSVGLHAEGMSLEEAQRRFEEDCFQDRATAREQAVRGTFDPGYFAYTLGKMQILSLREEARRALGGAFSLQRFHDVLLSHGAAPIPLVRERVLAELGVRR